MGSSVLTSAAVLNCGHGGTITAVPTQTRVFASKVPVLTVSDPFVPVGCGFYSGAYSPCTSIRWLVPSLRCKVDGKSVVTSGSSGLCIGPTQAPQGTPSTVSVQPRVSAQ